jgi:hypothetical protein
VNYAFLEHNKNVSGQAAAPPGRLIRSGLAQIGHFDVENGAKMQQNGLFFKLLNGVNSSRINEKRGKNCRSGLFFAVWLYDSMTVSSLQVRL